MVTGLTPLASAIRAYESPRQNEASICRSLCVSPPRPLLLPLRSGPNRGEDPPHYAGRHTYLTSGDVPDCGQELLHAGYFLKVARRAGGDRLDHRA